MQRNIDWVKEVRESFNFFYKTSTKVTRVRII